jgi:hypothetical protein
MEIFRIKFYFLIASFLRRSSLREWMEDILEKIGYKMGSTGFWLREVSY